MVSISLLHKILNACQNKIHRIVAYTFLNLCAKKIHQFLSSIKKDAHERKLVPFFASRCIFLSLRLTHKSWRRRRRAGVRGRRATPPRNLADRRSPTASQPAPRPRHSQPSESQRPPSCRLEEQSAHGQHNQPNRFKHDSLS